MTWTDTIHERPIRAQLGTPPASPTPLVEVRPGLLLKLECDNPGGSHKVRAARYIVRRAIKDGSIIPGITTIIEKTGGNFGFGLAVACQPLGVPVELAVGLGFSPIKRRCLQVFGASLIGVDMLEAGATPRQVIEAYLAEGPAQGKTYFYTDQFKNPGCLAAHEEETGPEIAAQISALGGVSAVTFVSGAGTGASLTGIARALVRAGLEVSVVLVEPEGCSSRDGVFIDRRLEGIAVGVTPPMVDWTIVDSVHSVRLEEMLAARRRIASQSGYFIGNSSAACLAAAERLVATEQSGHKVLVVIYDHGLWYSDF